MLFSLCCRNEYLDFFVSQCIYLFRLPEHVLFFVLSLFFFILRLFWAAFKFWFNLVMSLNTNLVFSFPQLYKKGIYMYLVLQANNALSCLASIPSIYLLVLLNPFWGHKVAAASPDYCWAKAGCTVNKPSVWCKIIHVLTHRQLDISE